MKLLRSHNAEVKEDAQENEALLSKIDALRHQIDEAIDRLQGGNRGPSTTPGS